MRRRTFLLGTSAVLASGGFLTGSGAFSTTAANRDVAIAIVGDRDAYLGLSTDDMDGGVLFEDGTRTAPEQFDIYNRTASDVSIDVTLDGTLRFTGASADSASVDVEDHHLTIRSLAPGEGVSDVTVDLSEKYSSGSLQDTLSFDVEGDGIQIEADRTLNLEPSVVAVELPNIGAPIRIPEIDSVDPSTLQVTLDGNEGETELVGNSGQVKLRYETPEDVGCESPSETVSVVVRGLTRTGERFWGSIDGVNCRDGSDESTETDADEETDH